MKKLTFYLLLLCFPSLTAQKIAKLPESKIPTIETESHMRFLASDELMGRKTGEQGNLVASRYIAEQFRLMGIKMVTGQNSYLQPVPFKNVKPVTEGVVWVGDSTLKIIDDFIVLDGKAAFCR